MNQMQTKQKQRKKKKAKSLKYMWKWDTVKHWVRFGTSLLWFISGQAWFSDGMEGDLLGVTSTGDAEYTTSAAGSGTSEYEKKVCYNLETHFGLQMKGKWENDSAKSNY